MAMLDRIRVAWTGFIGAPGVSTFYANDAATFLGPLHTFLEVLVPLLPSDTTLTLEAVGDTIDTDTGHIVGSWTGGVTAPIVGGSNASYTAVSGALVQWGTDTILSGRRLRGHTFLVPLTDVVYNTAGQITDSAHTAIRDGAYGLWTGAAGNMMLYQRPRLAAAAYTDRRGRVHPAITSRLGGYGPVTVSSCRTVVTELRSRRD